VAGLASEDWQGFSNWNGEVKVPQVSAQPFSHRAEAGKLLAARFSALAWREDVIVLALPRGGVPVGFEVANALGVALDVFVVRKLGVPGHEELAMGAIASGDVRLVNHDVVDALGIPDSVIDQVADRERVELARREQLYRGSQPLAPLAKKTVILVDDGLATGSTMRAAIAAVRQQQPASIIVGVPVGAASTCEELRKDADEVVCLRTPDPFVAVGLWYRDFSETPDSEVRALLGRNES
jgi:putative phosphoribosyl transferase